MEPLDRSTVWPYDERGEPGEFHYQRFGNPTVAAAEAALGELDGGTALLFPSGAGASTALVLSLLEPGDTIALAAGGYYGTGGTFAALAPWGVRVVEFDQTGSPPADVQLVWLEAPSNPYLTMPNLEAATAHPAAVVVDATVATPIHLRPLEHGADAETARKVETSTRVILNATSLGGVTSLIESRRRWEGERVPPGLLRLSVGLEDPETLWSDLEQALG